MLACGERLWWWLYILWVDSAVLPCSHGCPAFLCRHFPPQSPPSHPLNPSLHSQQQPSNWVCSTIPKPQLPAAAPSRVPASLSRVCMAVARTVWFSFRLGCYRSAVSLKCFSSDSDNCPAVGIGPLLPFPHLPRICPLLLTLLFFPLVPSSYWVLHGSLYDFSLVRSSCMLSAGVLYALLCLKVYSWCSHGERCIPPPLTPPSVPPHLYF